MEQDIEAAKGSREAALNGKESDISSGGVGLFKIRPAGLRRGGRKS